MEKEEIMSCLHNDMILDNIHMDVISEDEQGLLEPEIRDIVLETGLHADDDRDEILGMIAEERFENLPDGPQ
jgi:hypothetical protein